MANRFLVAGGTGNWDSTTNWAATSGAVSGASFPVAGDVVALDSNSGNASITVNVASACASLVLSGTYAGTLTFNNTLTLTSTVTFVSACTIAGTAGTLILGGTTTMTSGGKTLTCALTFSTSGTYTLADNWSVNGLVTLGSANNPTLNQTTTQKITCNGGFRTNGTTTPGGTAKIEIAGGTWDSLGGTLASSVDLAGNVTVSGTVTWGSGKTLRYVSGTITTTGSTLNLNSSTTLDTAGVVWNNLSVANSGNTHTLTSSLAWSGTITVGQAVTFAGAGTLSGTGAVTVTATLTLNNTGGLVTTGTLTLPNLAQTFAGTSGFTVGTLTTATLTASRIYTLTFGNTYTVTTAFSNVGTTSLIRQAIKSGTPGSKVVLTVTAGAALTLTYCDPTDVDSSAGGLVTSVGGTITTSLNWTGSLTAGAAGGVSRLAGVGGGLVG